MMKSALLFYRKLIKELTEMGFEINPYNPCVANKVVNGTQMTLRWHIDDLMISHISQRKILEFVRHIKDIYGDNLAKNVGMTHDYLGMTFDYAFEGGVWINMCKYLSKVIEDFPEEITGVSATPADDYLFKAREDGENRGSSTSLPANNFFFGRENYFFQSTKNTQKTDRRRTKRGPFFTTMRIAPPHRRDFPIDLQRPCLINRKIGDRHRMLNLFQHAVTIAFLLFFL